MTQTLCWLYQAGTSEVSSGILQQQFAGTSRYETEPGKDQDSSSGAATPP